MEPITIFVLSVLISNLVVWGSLAVIVTLAERSVKKEKVRVAKAKASCPSCGTDRINKWLHEETQRLENRNK